jgi:hypothetical protein
MLSLSVNGELLGTAFAVTKSHVITAHHNIHDEQSGSLFPGSLYICRRVEKRSSYIDFIQPIKLKYVVGNVDEDWAIMEIEDKSNTFLHGMPLCPASDLPDLTMNEHAKLKTYHAPIGQFLSNGFTDGEIWCENYKQILQYDRRGAVILVDGGLYRGSCGGPYIDHQGRVVAMHLSSMHEGKEFSRVKKRPKRETVGSLVKLVQEIDEQSTDLNDVHNSIRQGVVLSRINEVVAFIEKNK